MPAFATPLSLPRLSRPPTTTACRHPSLPHACAEPPVAAQNSIPDVRVNLRAAELPPAEQPADRVVLLGHEGLIEKVVAVPESGLFATGAFFPPGLRTFALDGDGDPMHIRSWFKGANSLAALGGDVLAMGYVDGGFSTWRASSGELLETFEFEMGTMARSISPLGSDKFVVGTGDGELVFFSHRDGRDLREVAPVGATHGDKWSGFVFARGDVIVTALGDNSAAVWDATTRERVAVLRGHSECVKHAAISARFIATSSDDKTVRVYEAGEGHALVRVIGGLNSDYTFHMEFVGDDLLMSTSCDGTVIFTSLPDARPVARVDVGFEVYSAMITPDARLCCVGGKGVFGGCDCDDHPHDRDDAIIFSPPAAVADAVKQHAAIVFPPFLPRLLADHEPLQAAMVELRNFQEMKVAALEVTSVENMTVDVLSNTHSWPE